MASDIETNETTQAQDEATTMAPAEAWEPPHKLTRRKRRKIIRRSILALAIVAYAIGAVFFSSHFTPGTTVDGIDAGLMTTSELAHAITTRAASYQLHVTNQDGFDMSIGSTDIALSCDGTRVAQEALDRTSPILWLGYLLSPQHMLIEAKVNSDEEAFTQIVESAVSAYNEQAEPPTNATGSYDEKSGSFVPTKESVGTALDTSKVLKQCTSSIRGLQEDLVLDKRALAQPTVADTDETLLASIKQANTILEAGDIDVTCGDQTVATIDKKTMVSWMSFTDEQKLKIDGVYNWVKGNDAIVDAGNASDDEHVWELDAQATCDDIHRVMEQDLGGTAEVKRTVVETKPAADPGAKQRGRHIDINLTTQFVRFYDSDSKVIWESYCVSGGWDPEFQAMHSTPTGTYAIQAKMTNQTLIGADTDKDGEPDYESFVNYWMPFLNYDYGLHDATWRGSFGPGIREWWGSHGCINLPYDKAEELFNLVRVGDTVYIHE